MSVSGDRSLLKPLVIGILSAVLIIAVLLCLSAVVLNLMPSVPYGIIDYLTTAVAGIGVLIGSYIASAVAKSRGLIIGLLCAFIILVLIIAIGLSNGENDVGIMTAIRSALLLLCGAFGGIRGVNRKEHIRIK